MKKHILYHEVVVSFEVTVRDAQRATGERGKHATRRLAEMLREAITDNVTNCLDAENVRIAVDGVAV